MTLSGSRIRPRPRRRRPWLRRLATLLALAVALAVGIAVGEALHDNPSASGTQTLIRTLKPLALVPIAQNTVTITTSKP